jgi:hypothetical protein
VIRQSDYEVGIAIYKNDTSNEFMVGLFVLFMKSKPLNFIGNLIVQTCNIKGLELYPLVSETINMNGRDLSIGLFKIVDLYFEQKK